MKTDYIYNLIVLTHDESDKLKGFVQDYITSNDYDTDIDIDKIMKHRRRDESEYTYYANRLVSIHQALKIADKDINEDTKAQLQLEFNALLNPTLGSLASSGYLDKVPELNVLGTELYGQRAEFNHEQRDSLLRKLATLNKEVTLLDFTHLEDDAGVLDLETWIENGDGDGVFVWSKNAFFRHETLDKETRLLNGVEQLYAVIDDNTIILGIPSKGCSLNEFCEVLADEYGFEVNLYFGNGESRSHLIYYADRVVLDKVEPSLSDIYSLLDALGIWESHCEYFGWNEEDSPNQIWTDEENEYAPTFGID